MPTPTATRTRGQRAAPPGASRQTVLDYLEANGGRVEDPSGRATSKLFEESNYKGQLGALTALLKAMDKDGSIVREINGKRCYSISLPRAAKTSQPRKATETKRPAPVTRPYTERKSNSSDVDYDSLAMALLQTVMSIVEQTPVEVDSSLTEEVLHSAKAETERLQAENERLAAELEDVRAQCRALASQLEKVEAERSAVLDRVKTLRSSRSDPSMGAIGRILQSR